MNIILFIIVLLLIIINVYLLYFKTYPKYQQQLKIQSENLNSLKNQCTESINLINNNYDKLHSLQNEIDNLNICLQEQEAVKLKLTLSCNNQQEKLNDLKFELQNLKSTKQQLQLKIDQIRQTYHAAAENKLKEKEKQNEWKFYSIQISENQISDINKLQEWKNALNDPSIVSKIIWSTYIIKPTTELCNRVLKTSKTVCGIYKITNKITGEIYIGQSINVAQRWKNHIKAGLGIEASPTNKLYNNMQATGVWNFTYQLLQECSRSLLNEKERFWIDMYQSNTSLGLNGTKGNK